MCGETTYLLGTVVYRSSRDKTEADSKYELENIGNLHYIPAGNTLLIPETEVDQNVNPKDDFEIIETQR